MARLLLMVLYVVVGSRATRITGGFHVDWEAEQSELAPAYAEYTTMFLNPGEIIPGLSVQDVSSAIGKTWHVWNMRDAFGVFCRDITPSLTPLLGASFISSICDPIFYALNHDTRIDGKGICQAYPNAANAVAQFMNSALEEQHDQHTPALGIASLREFDIVDLFDRVFKEVLFVKIYNPDSLCTAFDRLVNFPKSLQEVIGDIALSFLMTAMPRASEICHNWQQIYSALVSTNPLLGLDSSQASFFQNQMEEVTRLVAQASGYSDRESLCRELTALFSQADASEPPRRVGPRAVKSFAFSILQHMFDKIVVADQCSPFFHDVVNVVAPDLSRDVLDYYIRSLFDMPSIDVVCSYMESVFSFEGCTQDTCGQNGRRCRDIDRYFGRSFLCYCEQGFAGSDCGISKIN